MAKDFIPSRRNGEAYEALTDTLGSVPRRRSNWRKRYWAR